MEKKKPVARTGAADLLLEIGTEDLPARFVLPLSDALGQLGPALADAGVGNGGARIFSTPRRLAVWVERVLPRQAEREVVRKGPKLAAAIKDGKPTPAGLGFARSCGVDFAKLAREGGQLVFRTTEKGRTLAEVLPEVFDGVVKQMDARVPKRMRWGAGDDSFVRPVRWLTCLHGARVIPLCAFGQTATNRTYGHRFHAPQAIALKSPGEYARRLKAAKVIADFDARRSEVRTQVEAEAKKLKGKARITDELLDEVTALVEWPAAIHGRMEARFMALPSEVIIATIEHNQRYFPVTGRGGKLLPYFITVANLRSKDVKQVIAGNERVVRPRLADALFFWAQDRKRGLAGHVAGLDKVTFQKELGSIGDKARRVTELAVAIARKVGEDEAVVRRAAELCKADLVTRMVFEIPELQGVMGGHYARDAGEPDAVADAIGAHYQPTQSGGAIPPTGPGRVVALADKLDTLAGIFAVGLKPTGNKDPFALRRAALGAVRILIEGKLHLRLSWLIDTAVAQLPPQVQKDKLGLDLHPFVLLRLSSYCKDLGFDTKAVAAVLGNPLEEFRDVPNQLEWAQALMETDAGQILAEASKRMKNILKDAPDETAVDESAFVEPEERALYDAIVELESDFDALVKKGKMLATIPRFAQLTTPVAKFFEKVLVMVEDPVLQGNRMALLTRLHRKMNSFADISKLAI